MRKVQGTYVSGLSFKKESDWTRDNIDDELDENWTGKTIFIVDKHHSSDRGTDQTRQRVNRLITEEFPGQMRLIETTSPHKSVRCSELFLGDSRIILTCQRL